MLHSVDVLKISLNLHDHFVPPPTVPSFYYRTAVIHSMAVSAASAIGSATASVAGVTSVAITGTATAAVATVSTAATIVSPTDH